MHEIKSGDDLKAKPVQDNFDELATAIAVNSSSIETLKTNTSSKSDIATLKTDIPRLVCEALFPVGSLYITANNSCPMASIITGSTWQLVATGRALWCGNGSNGNSTIAAGLPDIYGQFANGQPSWAENPYVEGAFYYHTEAWRTANDGSRNTKVLRFNASRYNSIYGNSTTVQPPAYVVNVYRRTA